mgnify:FL=1
MTADKWKKMIEARREQIAAAVSIAIEDRQRGGDREASYWAGYEFAMNLNLHLMDMILDSAKNANE